METRDLQMITGSRFWRVTSADLKTNTRLLTRKLYSYTLDRSRSYLKTELQLSEFSSCATRDIMCLPVCLRTEELTASFHFRGPELCHRLPRASTTPPMKKL